MTQAQQTANIINKQLAAVDKQTSADWNRALHVQAKPDGVTAGTANHTLAGNIRANRWAMLG